MQTAIFVDDVKCVYLGPVIYDDGSDAKGAPYHDDPGYSQVFIPARMTSDGRCIPAETRAVCNDKIIVRATEEY